MKIWKVSHGQVLNDSDRDWLAQHNYLSVHEDTGNAGGDNFINKMKVNDIVSLSYSGQLVKLVKVTSGVIKDPNSSMEEGWQLRLYEEVKALTKPKQYKGVDKGWAPIRRNTCAPVPNNELTLFEQAILQPYYQLSLSKLAIKQKGTMQYQWIEKCIASLAFQTFINKKGLNKAALDDAIRVIHHAEPNFDLYNINKPASSLRFGRKESAEKSGKVAGQFVFEKGQLTLLFTKRYNRETKRLILSEDIKANEAAILQVLKLQLPTLIESGLTGKSRWPTDFGEEQANDAEDDLLGLGMRLDNNIPLNRILYGPPGTGKTYHTVQMAVDAVIPGFSPADTLDNTNSDEIRQAYKAKYDELIKAGRIRFVTFHQSYGYEEFVEGLSAKTEGGQLSYFEKDGVFKSICDEAKDHRVTSKDSSLSQFDQRWQLLANDLSESDLGIRIETLSKRTYFTVTDVTDSTIRFDKSNGKSVHSLSAKTLKAVYHNEKQINGGLQPYYGALIAYLNQFDLPATESCTERKHFVLIIDEINRGNISKVFGELITLIEPSKRLGQAESLEATLPYSGDTFSVPDNLYIIGTMNTADRSLALMDTALRRRFDFVEMMPNYKVLHDENDVPYCIVDGGSEENFKINLPELLQTLNRRITALYDREHVLGHAFLIPVIEKLKTEDHQGALAELENCFKNKILPLLAEYFFENWQKIHLVLGDNQKPETAQLIKKQGIDIASLFGDNEEIDVIDDDSSDYQLIATDSPMWQQLQTYIGIYHPKSIKE